MIRHFKTAAAFRAWLDAHHATTTELWVGFFKKHVRARRDDLPGSGRPGVVLRLD